MSSSDRVRRLRVLGAALLVGGALGLSACTVQPLYSARVATTEGETGTGLKAIRGRIAVVSAADRTAQIVRNALLFRLNGDSGGGAPLYEIRYTASGYESVAAIQQGSGIPAASLYRMTVTYQVARLSDGKVIGIGSRFATAPFDRTRQAYAASRAVLEARERAGETVAGQIELAVLSIIRKDIAATPPRGRG